MTTRSRFGALAVALLLALPGPLAADAPTGPRSIPDVAGLARADAERRLGSAGFEIEIVMEPSSEIAEGVVIRQEPGGFAIREFGSTVRVIVSGKPEAKQPDPQRGPKPRPPAPTPSEPPPAPPPSEPTPPAAEEPPAGPLPELPPAAPPEPAPAAPAPTPEPPPAAQPGLGELPQEPGLDLNGPPLPNAIGMSRQEAEAALQGWTLTMEVTLASPAEQGRVVEQVPAMGQTLAHGQPVTLVFGLAQEPGTQYRQVPALDGLTPEHAQARLAQVGYVASFCTIPSENDKAGRVVDTTPRRFSFLLKGEAVRVRIGRGNGTSLPAPVTEHPTPVPAPAEPTPTVPDDGPPAGPLPSEPTPVEPRPVPSEPPPPPPTGGEPPPPTEPPGPPPPVAPPVVEPAPAPPPLPEPAPFPAQPVRPPPGRTALMGPAEGDSFPKAYGPSFEWQTVPHADGYEWELEREETEGVWRPARSEKLIGTKYRPARLEAARYRWRVRALNGETPGEWTTWRRLFLY